VSADIIALPLSRDAEAHTTLPMAGCVVLVTADRRADQLSSLFARRGAIVRHTPVLTLIPHSNDPQLLAATQALLRQPPDLVVVTTAVGFRGWIEAADSVGMAEELLRVLAGARIMARGPKALGAVQSAGLTAHWCAPSETSAEMVSHLLEAGVRGLRIAVQHHAGSSDPLTEALSAAGAQVIDLVMYRLGPPPNFAAVEASIHLAASGQLDTVCFTSAMAVHAWFDAAEELGLVDELRRRNAAGELVVAAVGPVTAAPLLARAFRPVVPDRSRLGALVRAVADHYAQQAAAAIPTVAGDLQLRATGAVLDDRLVSLTPAALDVLKLLARQPGAVVSRAQVLDALPGCPGSEHAAEVAVSRLRECFGSPGVIRTVVKRGYRLDLRETAMSQHS
jgi:uroporphyrinogen-III synthase